MPNAEQAPKPAPTSSPKPQAHVKGGSAPQIVGQGGAPPANPPKAQQRVIQAPQNAAPGSAGSSGGAPRID